MLKPIEKLSAMLAALEFFDEADIAAEHDVSLDNCTNPIKENVITPIEEAVARLTVLEVALSGRISSRLAHLSSEDSKKWKEDFIRVFKTFDFTGKEFKGYQEEVYEAEYLKLFIKTSERFVQEIAHAEEEFRDRLKKLNGIRPPIAGDPP